MTLLAMGETLVIFGYTYERFVGATLGIFVPSFLGFIPLENRPYIRLAIYITIELAIYLIVRKFINSPLGRVLRSIRDNESLASSLGKDIVSYRKKLMICRSYSRFSWWIINTTSRSCYCFKLYQICIYIFTMDNDHCWWNG